MGERENPKFLGILWRWDGLASTLDNAAHEKMGSGFFTWNQPCHSQLMLHHAHGLYYAVKEQPRL